MSELNALVQEAQAQIAAANDVAAIEQVRVQYLGKKSRITELSKALGQMGEEERRAQGAVLNQAREAVTSALSARRDNLAAAALTQKLEAERVDVTLPGRGELGGLHPVTRVLERIEGFFTDIGFKVAAGPEVEDDFHNFEALNIPAHHPARAASVVAPPGRAARDQRHPGQRLVGPTRLVQQQRMPAQRVAQTEDP